MTTSWGESAAGIRYSTVTLSLNADWATIARGLILVTSNGLPFSWAETAEAREHKEKNKERQRALNAML